MDKQDETGLEKVRAVTLLIRWLQEETENSKVRQALALLAEQTRTSLEKGNAPPTSDVRQIAAWHSDNFGGPWTQQSATGRWLPSKTVRTWWETRANSRRQFLSTAGAEFDVHLDIDKGGGRSNSTTYQFSFEPLPVSPGFSTEEPEDDELSGDGWLRYKREPAKAALVWRPLLGRPFPVRSFRGLAFMLVLALPFTVFLLCMGATAWLLLIPKVAFGPLVFPLLTIAFLSGLTTRVLKPLWSLPVVRITVAPDWTLAMSQMDGQFRLTHGGEKRTGGHFSLMRHWSRCTVCSGTVDIRDGDTAFPGRLVGCCSANPREHVYSFDAVTLTGALLIPRPSAAQAPARKD